MVSIRVGITALLLVAATTAAAQDRPVRIEGRVAWIAGQDLVIVPDGNPSIKVDLRQLPQDQHAKLREGDRIVVMGVPTNERDRVVAAAIERPGP